MIENIHIYEMPKQRAHQKFQLYEVKGESIQNKNYPHRTDKPHRHKYYEICIFINGAGKHEIDFNIHSIQSYSIHFLTPGQVHLISREKKYHGYLLVFSREFYALGFQNKEILLDLPFFNNNSQVPILNLSPKEFKEFIDLIESLKYEYTSGRDISEQIIRAYLHIFLMKSKYYFRKHHLDVKATEESIYELLSSYRSLIEKHFTTLHEVKEYADLMSVTPVYLNKVVKKLSGMSASEHIMDRIILEAKRMLVYTSLNNNEIAYQMHYEDPSYFSRIFKKKTGFSPGEFRNKFS